jgi:hypothetical protein
MRFLREVFWPAIPAQQSRIFPRDGEKDNLSFAIPYRLVRGISNAGLFGIGCVIGGEILGGDPRLGICRPQETV